MLTSLHGLLEISKATKSQHISFLAYLLQKFANSNSIRQGQPLHALILTTIPETPPFLNNNLLSMYARCGHLEDAQKVFDTMSERTIVSWNSLIAAYSHSSNHHHASFALFLSLKMATHDGLKPNNSTFASLLLASSFLDESSHGETIHSQCIKSGFSDDLRAQTSLIGFYSKFGNLGSANQVFNGICNPDTISWNSIIIGHLQNESTKQGLHLFCNMVRTGTKPNCFTFAMALNTCSKRMDGLGGKSIHAQIIRTDCFVDVSLQNALIDMYCNCGERTKAFAIFSEIVDPDLVSWNSMIAGFAEDGKRERAMDLFTELRKGERPDEYSFAAIVSTIGALPAQCYGKPLHAQILKGGYESSIFTGSTLIDMYFKNREADSANKIFDGMGERDAIVWTEMITGHALIGHGDMAIKYFCNMERQGHKPDQFALSSVLSSCADLASLQKGEIIHSKVIKLGYDNDNIICGSLIDMYSKSGNLIGAIMAFSGVAEPDLECWNAMLGGYSHHGNAEEAFEIFNRMVKRGIEPDQVTFVLLLSSCSHRHLVERGKLLWDRMVVDYGILPGIKHYTSMVGLFSRAGLLKEAEILILGSPFGTDFLELWRILLSSCIDSGDLVMGLKLAERVLSFEPEDTATFVLLSNVYAVAERWEDVAKVRRKIKALGLEKDPGLSWIELKNRFHVFSAGDESHPLINNVLEELKRLEKNMKESEKQTQVLPMKRSCDL
ncbi:hypothetical protein AMTRI_Chr13g91720 [Amborella trichopoda]